MDNNQLLLLGIAIGCAGLFAYSYYGNKIDKDSKLLKCLQFLGGGAYALNFIIGLNKAS